MEEVEADRQLRTGEGDDLFLGMKLAATTYYKEVVVPEATALTAAAMIGDSLFYSVPEDAFAA